MTAISTEELAGLRAIRDRLGRHGDLFMRLSGFYRIGPDGPVEPEFGYRDVRDSGFRQPIQVEAAQALADVSARVLELEAANAKLRNALVSVLDDMKGYNLVGGHAYASARAALNQTGGAT
ncbi:hypothetical protein RM190_04770 [Paracoccus sp. CPCC 101403]|uniref:Uncharacterized protein n=1 Tax=Paracoccus broussonetiae TaxID=3075834 RepID=A0ABU3EAI8_9RHOB|nr:hypothetical protein [Paracoccus sp. CPCC 101403]MDT1061161.1 hypothetical protein [Paracoccus sp. CPCC 101403]